MKSRSDLDVHKQFFKVHLTRGCLTVLVQNSPLRCFGDAFERCSIAFSKHRSTPGGNHLHPVLDITTDDPRNENARSLAMFVSFRTSDGSIEKVYLHLDCPMNKGLLTRPIARAPNP